MSHRPSKAAADLTQGWPEDPANEDLARLGQEIFANRPELSQLALDRIQIRMRREMNRPWWQRRWRTLLVCFVGAVALSLGAYGLITSSSRNPARETSGSPAPTPAVRDRYQVTLPGSSPRAPDRPVVDLGRYNDLIGRQGKEPKQ